jgi:uncharacterized protein (DUF2252 family)
MLTQPAVPDSLVHAIRYADRQRRPDLLPLKYQAMRESSFRFYRATPYLFYAAWVGTKQLADHPLTWVCGDLHLENMGSYRANNGLIYFDINDFDEAQLAPCSIDLARMVTSLFVAARDWKMPVKMTRSLSWYLITAYKQRLLSGKPRSIEREAAAGVLKGFLDQVATRSQRALLDRYTQGHGRHRHLRTDGSRLLQLPEAERDTILPWLERTLASYGGFHVRDIAFRLAGTSSLGLDRYAALVQTKKEKYKLLDIKAVMPSVGHVYWADRQPDWPDSATRVVTLQHRLQDVSPNHLQPLSGPAGESFVMRSLQPQADRINLQARSIQKADRLRDLLETVAQLMASAHLRSGGQQGSAITDELIDFARQPGWDTDLLHQAELYAQQVRRDYRQFCTLSLSDLISP